MGELTSGGQSGGLERIDAEYRLKIKTAEQNRDLAYMARFAEYAEVPPSEREVYAEQKFAELGIPYQAPGLSKKQMVEAKKKWDVLPRSEYTPVMKADQESRTLHDSTLRRKLRRIGDLRGIFEEAVGETGQTKQQVGRLASVLKMIGHPREARELSRLQSEPIAILPREEAFRAQVVSCFGGVGSYNYADIVRTALNSNANNLKMLFESPVGKDILAGKNTSKLYGKYDSYIGELEMYRKLDGEMAERKKALR